MLNVNKKNKLILLLKKLGDTEFNGNSIIEEVIKELARLEKEIPKLPDLSPYYNDVKYLRGKQASLASAVSSVSDRMNTIYDHFIKRIENSDSSHAQIIKDLTSTIEDLRKTLEKLEKQPRTPPPYGGGNMNRKISVNGTDILTRYTDINLKGSGVTYTAVNNNTTKQVDLTLTASGGGGSVSVETPPETPNASIVNFTVSAQPKWIVADGITYFEGAGYSYSSLTVTMDLAPSSWIRAII